MDGNNVIQLIYNFQDYIEIPTEDIVFLKAKESLPEEFRNKRDKDYVSNISHNYQLMLAQEISKNNDERYSLLSAERTVKEYYTNPIFKEFLKSGSISNREIFLEPNIVIPDPKIRKIGSRLEYTGKKIEVNLKRDVLEKNLKRDVLNNTLKSAGLIEKDIYLSTGSIFFHEGKTPLWSTVTDSGTLFMDASFSPSFRSPIKYIALEKIKED